MRAGRLRLAALLLAAAGLPAGLRSAESGPNYPANGIVNAADNRPGPLAPNTIASIYGTGLSYVTRSITPQDIRGGVLPTDLPGTGVHVVVGNWPADIYFVSPLQINFLVPSNLLPGPTLVQVILDGHAGPPVKIHVAAASPALFQLDQHNAVAIHYPDNAVVTEEHPAKPGDIVILYATGLGETVPPIPYGEVPTAAAPLERMPDFRLVLDGKPADGSAVLYAGIAPGFAGLYQLNLLLPASTGPDPEIRIGMADQLSKPGLHLPVKP